VYTGAIEVDTLEMLNILLEPSVELNMIMLLPDAIDPEYVDDASLERTKRDEEVRKERDGLVREILTSYVSSELQKVKTPFEWQRYLPQHRDRFVVLPSDNFFFIEDTWKGCRAVLSRYEVLEENIDIVSWAAALEAGMDLPDEEESVHSYQEGGSQPQGSEAEDSAIWADNDPSEDASEYDTSDTSYLINDGPEDAVWCGPVQKGKRSAKKPGKDASEEEKLWENMEDNSGYPRDKCVVPLPMIITVYINRKPCKVLVDTGAFADFISMSAVKTLGLKKEVLSTPIPLQMAVQGSRSKINTAVSVKFKYATIECQKRFDVLNLATYDLILGTPFMWQHSVMVGMNPTRIAVGNDWPLPMQGDDIRTILSAMMIQEASKLEKIRDMLRSKAKELCEDTALAALPPFHAINHHIYL
jgi:hypothetical protein